MKPTHTYGHKYTLALKVPRRGSREKERGGRRGMRGKKKNLMRTTFLQEEGWVTEMQEVGAMVLWEKEKREAWDLG